MVRKELKRVVEKSFIVRAPLEVAWNHISEVEKWPSWAKHIRSVAKSPPGPLSLHSRGTLKLTNGVKTTFKMIEFEPLRHWKWVGPFLGLQIHYDHIFSRDEPGRTKICFTVDATGGPGVVFRGIFARIYRKNLERAVPLLIQEIETIAGAKSSVGAAT